MLKEHPEIAEVLIIEDDKDLANILRRQLLECERSGMLKCNVTCVSTAKEAILFSEKYHIDIFIVDLGIPDQSADGPPSGAVGRALVAKLVQRPNSGIVIYSSEPKRDNARDLIRLGADDYIQKTDDVEFVIDKIFSLWRRVLGLKQAKENTESDQLDSFGIGDLCFTLGNQIIENTLTKENHKLSITEYELVKYLVTNEDHTITLDQYKSYVLRRKTHVDHKALENTIFRIRKKLGDSFRLEHKRGGFYYLQGVQASKKHV